MTMISNIVEFPCSVSRKAHARKLRTERKEHKPRCELERDVFARLLQHFDPRTYAIALEEIAKAVGS
jgi:hypothetical protein